MYVLNYFMCLKQYMGKRDFGNLLMMHTAHKTKNAKIIIFFYCGCRQRLKGPKGASTKADIVNYWTSSCNVH